VTSAPRTSPRSVVSSTARLTKRDSCECERPLVGRDNKLMFDNSLAQDWFRVRMPA